MNEPEGLEPPIFWPWGSSSHELPQFTRKPPISIVLQYSILKKTRDNYCSQSRNAVTIENIQCNNSRTTTETTAYVSRTKRRPTPT